MNSDITVKEKFIYALCNDPSSYLEECIRDFWAKSIADNNCKGFHEAWVKLNGEKLDPMKCAEKIHNHFKKERKILFTCAFKGIIPNTRELFAIKNNSWPNYIVHELKKAWHGQKPLKLSIEPNIILQVTEQWLYENKKDRKSHERAHNFNPLLVEAGIIQNYSQVRGTAFEFETGNTFHTFVILKESLLSW